MSESLPGSAAVTCREMIPSDLASIQEVGRQAQAAAKFPIGSHWTSEQIEEDCAHLGWVAENLSGGVDAFVLMRSLGPKIREITFLATAPNAQGQGRMRELLKTIIGRSSADMEIWLEVHEANEPARKLYESVGFRQTGKRPKYYADGQSAVLYNYG